VLDEEEREAQYGKIGWKRARSMFEEKADSTLETIGLED